MRKTSVISIRVSEDEKNKLFAESEMKSITLNTLVGQILSKYVKWDRYTNEIGYIFLTRPFLRAILNIIDEKDISIITGNTCRGTIRDTVLFTKGEINLENILSALDMWLGASHIPFRHVTDDHGDRYVVKHDLGKKFSMYLASLINSTLNEIGIKIDNQKLDDQNITFEIGRI